MSPVIESIAPVSELPPGSRVLDLGCGGGSLSYAEYPEVQFFGVDEYRDPRTNRWPASSRLALARSEQLPFADGSFDGAICNFVFEHFNRPQMALRELERVVRPGGFCYISVPFSASLHDRLYRFTFKGGGHLQRYTFESFLRMVYSETSFKMRAFSPMQSGFLWIHDVPFGSMMYGMLFRALRWLGKGGYFPLDGGDCKFLLTRGEERGYLTETPVCAGCGMKGVRQFQAAWDCRMCGFSNITVPASLEVTR